MKEKYMNSPERVKTSPNTMTDEPIRNVRLECKMSIYYGSPFSIGTPKQVEDYTKKLIDKIGMDGGHILGSGCEVPPNCKPENFKTYLQVGKTYLLLKN